MTTLVDKVIALCAAFEQAHIPYALGGALALAYATKEPRGTRDIDVNVFVDTAAARHVFDSLPSGVTWADVDLGDASRDGQVRLWWDDTPVDMFFAEAEFHHEVARRCHDAPFAGVTVRVLSAEDLAVFKAMFDRPKDWVDIATMVEAEALDVALAAERLGQLLGADPRVGRLDELA